MIRYRDGKIVSTKGERFTQVSKQESEEMKRSIVNIQLPQLTKASGVCSHEDAIRISLPPLFPSDSVTIGLFPVLAFGFL